MSSLGHGVDCITNQVGKELAQLTGETVKIGIRPVLGHLDLQRKQLSRVNSENGIEQLARLATTGEVDWR